MNLAQVLQVDQGKDTRLSGRTNLAEAGRCEPPTDIFVTSSVHPVSFEVVTGSKGADLGKLQKELGELRDKMVAVNDSVGVRLGAKRESKGASLPHTRYLITDQIGFSFDPGFDILQGSSDTVKRVVIGMCPDRGSVRADVQSLPWLLPPVPGS